MRLGDVANPEAARFPKPLTGVRVLALEQMQSLPYATQLLGRLGAEVVKVEHPTAGESGRASQPAMLDPQGRNVGATFLRNNLSKQSVGIDLKSEAGRDLVLRLAPKFDIVAENFKGGTMARLGLGYDDLAAVHPAVIYLSVSGFGDDPDSPYADWPAYASIVEGMSGIYEYMTQPGTRPRANPVGALGDISSALFSVIGVLAALRQRDLTGEGQRVDIAMYDATIAMTDIVMNFASMGIAHGSDIPVLLDTFAAADGWFVMQVVREHQFEALADLLDHPEWNHDERFATRAGWLEHCDSVIRPAVEQWASTRTKREAVDELANAGVVSGPCHDASDLIADPHVARRSMSVEVPRTDHHDSPILVPGNPVKLSKMAEGPESRVPWLGEHTDTVLAAELGLDATEIAALRSAGTIG
jgi:formyl-CoA transferase